MPAFEEHCRDCEYLIGDRCEEVNRWIDELFTHIGPKHRAVRHHREGVAIAAMMYGPVGRKAAVIHILKDCGHIPVAADYREKRVDLLGIDPKSNFNGCWDPQQFAERTRELGMKEMKGVAFLFSETGTEGGWWAMQEDGYLAEDGIHESYHGLRYLEEGDDFTVYAEDGSVLWQGIIHKDETTGLKSHHVFRDGKWVEDRTWKQQVVGGMWVHWVQAGIDPEVWGDLFLGNKRCLVKREDRTK